MLLPVLGAKPLVFRRTSIASKERGRTGDSISPTGSSSHKKIKRKKRGHRHRYNIPCEVFPGYRCECGKVKP